ncbi:MAG: hypothetical protein D6753_05020 [Planctomycetota bacterium]|nr:MAG: hypothetical protein D6753_05020 [Planctomycetota bacterium]
MTRLRAFFDARFYPSPHLIPMLVPIALDRWDEAEEYVASRPRWMSFLDAAQEYAQSYWDRYPSRRSVQLTTCNYREAAAGLLSAGWAIGEPLTRLSGLRFVEWGCGFGGVTGAAALLGMQAVGIEAQDFLCRQAARLWQDHAVAATVWSGNFLPRGAENLWLPHEPRVALDVSAPDVYEKTGTSPQDFDLFFAYPWPGEERFIERVFDEFARGGAYLLLYRGPYHLELWRKGTTQ